MAQDADAADDPDPSRPGSRDLLVNLEGTVSAFVQDEVFEVVDANTLATALCRPSRQARHLLRATFLDPDLRALYDDWRTVSREAVAGLRAMAGAEAATPGSRSSSPNCRRRANDFRQLWELHEVVPKLAASDSCTIRSPAR